MNSPYRPGVSATGRRCPHLLPRGRRPFGGPAAAAARAGPLNSSETSANHPQPLRVHVAAVPLVGWEAAAARLGRLYPDQLALHTLVLLQAPDGGCVAYDFLPTAPTSPVTVARLLGGLAVPGEARTRLLRRGLPSKRCWFVAEAPDEAAAQAAAFQRAWPTELRLLRNDCRSHTNSLVQALTGVPNVLSTLPIVTTPLA